MANSGGEALVVLATLVSIQLAQGRSADELQLISSFFEVLGDNLSLIAAQRTTPASLPQTNEDRRAP